MQSAFKEKRITGGTLQNGTEYEVIQGSLRPDGTRRPDIKVRKGYVAQDEVKAYETKGSQWREKQEAVKDWVPGMSPEMHANQKAVKAKVAEEKQAQRPSGRLSDAKASLQNGSKEAKSAPPKAAPQPNPSPDAPAVADLRKRRRALVTKRGEILKLEAEAAGGKELNADQQAKLARRPEV
eukprot:EG_transcript_34555